MNEPLYLGLISGTSRDGVDLALARFPDGKPELLAARCVPYPENLRSALDRLIERGQRPALNACAGLDRDLGQFFGEACMALLDDAGRRPAELRAIGSHGQTVWHEPHGDDPVSLQLGDAAVMARLTGITVVTNFRSADLRAGGEGAPLAPLLHRTLFRHLAPCAVLNLGGIANLTLLGEDGHVRGFDTGPANCLMDLWCKRHTGQAYDDKGAWAASGQVLPDLLARLLDDPWFDLPPPKSTGLEHFNTSWMAARLEGDEAASDVQRTLLELSVATVAGALQTAARAGEMPPGHVLVCGGGVHNGLFLRRLRDSLGGVAVESTATRGVDPDWVEAMLFAWLAAARLDERLQDTPPVTGADHPVLLGTVTPAF